VEKLGAEDITTGARSILHVAGRPT